MEEVLSGPAKKGCAYTGCHKPGQNKGLLLGLNAAVDFSWLTYH
jgi:hypothetical protein